MCFDRDASPPILAGDHAIGTSGRLTLQSSDGTQFGAFEATAEGVASATVLILPDVRGLHPYYEELACRFAQHGFRSLAIDYFGRTAPPPQDRPADFGYHEHVDRVRQAELQADVTAAVEHLRSTDSGHISRSASASEGGCRSSRRPSDSTLPASSASTPASGRATTSRPRPI